MTGLRITGFSDRAKRARALFATTIRIVLGDVLDGRRDGDGAMHTLELRLRAEQRRYLGKPPRGHLAWLTFGPPIDMKNLRDAHRRGGAAWVDALNRARTAPQESANVRT